MPEEDYPIIGIVGPTGSGKSALALALAERLKGEIVNYDSVQVYRGFDIGSGKVPLPERRGISHHLLDRADPRQTFTAGDYRREALGVLAEVRERRNLPILVGGTGLYLRALLLGLFEGPPRSEELRERLRSLGERRGREFLHRLLRRVDPETAKRIGQRDTQKIIRALEVCLLCRRPFSALLARGRSGLQGFRALKIGLNPDRAELYQHINRRVEQMFAAGLLEETRVLLAALKGSCEEPTSVTSIVDPAQRVAEAEARTAARAVSARPGPSSALRARCDQSEQELVAKSVKPFGALGYRQACAVLQEEMSLPDAIRKTQAATRQYAKRQLTWFRRESEVTWFAGFGDDREIQRQVFNWLAGTNRLFGSSWALESSPR